MVVKRPDPGRDQISLPQPQLCHLAQQVRGQGGFGSAALGQIWRGIGGRQVAPALKRPARHRCGAHQLPVKDQRAAANAVGAGALVQTQQALAGQNNAFEHPENRTARQQLGLAGRPHAGDMLGRAIPEPALPLGQLVRRGAADAKLHKVQGRGHTRKLWAGAGADKSTLIPHLLAPDEGIRYPHRMSALPPPAIGHNLGPATAGASWRTVCWRHARAELMPHLPIEVVRLQVHRARALGLPYKTYAGVRASTGRDLVAFLFSTNGLGVFRQSDRLASEQAATLARIAVRRDLGCAPRLAPAELATRLAPDGSFATARMLPPFGSRWGAMRREIKEWLAREGLPGDGVLMIGVTDHEVEMAGAGGLAAFIPGERYFAEACHV